MTQDPLVIYFVVGAIAVLACGFVMTALRQPMITGYILAGFALGPHALGLVQDQELIASLGAVGVVILLFFIGTEVSPRQIVSRWQVALIGTSLQVLVSVALVAALGSFFDWPLARSVLIGFVISLSCTAIVVDYLKRRGEFDSRVGQDSLMILVTQDLFVVPMLIVLGLFSGGGVDSVTIVQQLLGGVLIVSLIAMVMLRDSFEIPFIERLSSDPEMQVFSALLLCFGLALVTGMLQLSTALGAFVAGVIVGQARNVAWVLTQLHALRVVFVAIFFASVGMLIDIALLIRYWREITVLVVLVLLTNTLVNAVILRLLRRSWPESIYGGALLAHVGEFSFVLAAIGFNAGIIAAAGYQITIATIAISLALGPAWVMIVRRMLPPLEMAS